MTRDGFDPQHEVPVVVRESARTLLASPAYDRWRAFTRHNAAVLPPLADFSGRAHAFTTLGSSHLNLALRLVQTDTPSVFGRGVRYGPALERDARLRDAIFEGLPSVVLRDAPAEPPKASLLHAPSRARRVLVRAAWTPLGDARANASPRGSARGSLTLFQSLARTLDSEELSSLARIKYGYRPRRSQRVQEMKTGTGTGNAGGPPGDARGCESGRLSGGQAPWFAGGWIRDERARAGRGGGGG